jgi:hypothetical protein
VIATTFIAGNLDSSVELEGDPHASGRPLLQPLRSPPSST